MRIALTPLALAITLHAVAPPLAAQTAYTFTKIVETGTVGSNGQTIVLCNFNVPTTINDSGTVAFYVANSGGIGLCLPGNGLAANWTGNGSTPLLIYPLDGQGMNGVGAGAVIASGEVAFTAPDPFDLLIHLYLGNGGQPTLVARGAFGNRFVSADDGGAVAVVSDDWQTSSFQVHRYDAPLAVPVVIDSDAQSSHGPFVAINAGLEVAFTKIDPSAGQVFHVLKGSGGPLTTIAQAGDTINGMTLMWMDYHVAIRDDGFVAFQGVNIQQGTGIYRGNGSQTVVVVDTQGASPFQGVNNPALNNAGQIAFYGVLKAAWCPGGVGFCDGIYTGADPVADKVIQTGDVIDGLTVVDVDNSTPPSINDKGQIAIGVWLQGDDSNHYAVYRADPPNHPPVLAAIGNKAVAELSTLSFTATASDPDAGDSLTFSLDAGAPAGAAISSAGAFSWTPTEAQGPGTYAVGIRVSDNGTPVESDAEVISIQVTEVNSAPVLATIGNKTVKQGGTLTFTASASDSDLPKNTLTFSLGPGAPAGATINPVTGAFSWKPSNKQGPGNYSVTVRVADSGSPTLSASETITVTVMKKGGKP